jgi:hypothetical protein
MRPKTHGRFTQERDTDASDEGSSEDDHPPKRLNSPSSTSSNGLRRMPPSQVMQSNGTKRSEPSGSRAIGEASAASDSPAPESIADDGPGAWLKKLSGSIVP